MDLGGQVGNKSSAWVTSDGNTAYILSTMGLTAPPPSRRWTSATRTQTWSVTETVNWAAAMQYHSTSVTVDDVLYALSSSGWLTFDTSTDTAGEVGSAATGRMGTRTSMKRTASFEPFKRLVPALLRPG